MSKPIEIEIVNPNVPSHNLQTKVITPSKEVQVVTADEGYYGLREVIVSATPFNNDDVVEEINDVKTMLTDGADATPNDIKLGKTAYVGGKLITGTFEIGGTIEITDTEIKDVTNYQYAQVVDNNLKAENIASGKNILGFEGTFSQDATATAEDILNGKSAYVNGEKVVGKFNLAYELMSHQVGLSNLFVNKPDLAKMLESLEDISEFNFGGSNSIFKGCNTLVKLPFKVILYAKTSMVGYNHQNLFYDCHSLEEADLEVRTQYPNLSSAFQNCYNLKTIKINTSSSISDTFCFVQNCYELETIEGVIKIRGGGSTANMFYNCAKLKNLTFGMIQKSLQIGSGTSYGHLLTMDSLLSAIQACYKSSTKYTLTVGTANIEKLANVYVKLKDSYSTYYYQFDVCESTDDGAMTIDAYMALKNWNIA